MAAALLTVLAAIVGIPVASHLSAGGFQDPGSESAQAARILSKKFNQSDQQLLITVTDPGGAAEGPARDIGIGIVGRLTASPNVLSVTSPWTSPPSAAAELLSTDGSTALIVATLAGGEDKAQEYAVALSAPVVGVRDRRTRTVRWTFRALPKPLSASTMSGNATRSRMAAMVSATSDMETRPISEQPNRE